MVVFTMVSMLLPATAVILSGSLKTMKVGQEREALMRTIDLRVVELSCRRKLSRL